MTRKIKIKSFIVKIHLWLGLTSGLLVFFLGITGCILAFQLEIENATQEYRFTQVREEPLLLPSVLKNIADKEVPNKHAHSISYEPGKSSQVIYFSESPSYYYCVFLNPYTGEVLKTKNMDQDFFRIMVMGHYYLWLPPTIGQPILASATLIFVIMLITGLFLWWPKNKAAAANRFTIKWNARWRRVNYDLHNVIGFYISWITIFIALTGLIMGFIWFSKSIYWISSGGEEMKFYTESFSDTTNQVSSNSTILAMDQIWINTKKANLDYKGSIEVHPPVDQNSSIEIALNPLPGTYWKTDYLFYDQYTLKEIPVEHIYRKYEQASFADKIMRMNYDIHVGAIGGIVGKTIAFFASLFASSLPITGFLIWWGKRNKRKKEKRLDNCDTKKLEHFL